MKKQTMKQLTIQLPPDLLDKIESAKGARSWGDEVRRRLEMTFARPELPEETQQLLNQIVSFAERFDGDWSLVPTVFKAFKAGVSVLIDTHQPSGQRPKKYDQKEWERLEAQFGNDDPEVSGRAIARSIRRPGHKLP